jgi:hydroxypyruvate reductase
MGVGYDGVDVAAAKARGVMVTHTPDVLNDEVADLALGLMLCAARQLPAADRYVRAGEWLKGPMPLARKMTGARLGMVGMGRIGQAIAHRARWPSACRSPTPRAAAKPELPYRFFPTPAALAGRERLPGRHHARRRRHAQADRRRGAEGAGPGPAARASWSTWRAVRWSTRRR